MTAWLLKDHLLWLSGGDQGASPAEQGLVLAHSCPSGKGAQDFERMLLLNPSFHLSYKLSYTWSLTADISTIRLLCEQLLRLAMCSAITVFSVG